jgi:hypothetical protein
MNPFSANGPPSRVPTLTEVVEVAKPGEAVAQPALIHPANTNTNNDVDVLTQQIMASIQRQVDAMLEVRLKEALGPVITRLTDALARDTRAEVAKAMKEVVARVVADELRRSHLNG